MGANALTRGIVYRRKQAGISNDWHRFYLSMREPMPNSDKLEMDPHAQLHGARRLRAQHAPAVDVGEIGHRWAGPSTAAA